VADSLPSPTDDSPPTADLNSADSALPTPAWELDVDNSASAAPLGSAEPVAPAAPPPLVRIVEALLFVGGSPLSAERAGQAVRGLTPAQFLQAIDTLNKDYRRQARPYSIRPQGSGYVLNLQSRYLWMVEKLFGGTREARLSPAAVDVLALVAYRQPATKQEIDSLRGAESGALLRQLVRRGLVAIVQRAEAGQKEVSYGTTSRFLELFGLKGLDDLPQTQDLQVL
jgi:segregation and condensation protein B